MASKEMLYLGFPGGGVGRVGGRQSGGWDAGFRLAVPGTASQSLRPELPSSQASSGWVWRWQAPAVGIRTDTKQHTNCSQFCDNQEVSVCVSVVVSPPVGANKRSDSEEEWIDSTSIYLKW